MRGRLAAAVLISAALGVRPAPAQIVSGQVVDARTERPRSSVHVELRADSTDVLLDTAVTDQAGSFSINKRPLFPFTLHFSLATGSAWSSRAAALGEKETYERLFVVPPTVELTCVQSQVTRVAAHAEGSGGPRYPDAARRKGIEGAVTMEFVVDSLGGVDNATARAARVAHRAFPDAVAAWLPTARFRPAEVNGVKVPHLVEAPYLFTISK